MHSPTLERQRKLARNPRYVELSAKANYSFAVSDEDTFVHNGYPVIPDDKKALNSTAEVDEYLSILHDAVKE